jgi:hypothetical protein
MMCKVFVVGATVPLVLFNNAAASGDNMCLANLHHFIHAKGTSVKLALCLSQFHEYSYSFLLCVQKRSQLFVEGGFLCIQRHDYIIKNGKYLYYELCSNFQNFQKPLQPSLTHLLKLDFSGPKYSPIPFTMLDNWKQSFTLYELGIVGSVALISGYFIGQAYKLRIKVYLAERSLYDGALCYLDWQSCY